MLYGTLSAVANGLGHEMLPPGGPADAGWFVPFFLLAAATTTPRARVTRRLSSAAVVLVAGPAPLVLDRVLGRALPSLGLAVSPQPILLLVTSALLAWDGASRDAGGGVGAAPPGVLHCFSGDALMAASLAARGFLVSFALPVSFRSAIGPRAAAFELPQAAILVETDAPWLGPGSERRNEPTTALRVAVELARLRAATPETIAGAANANLARLLRTEAIRS